MGFTQPARSPELLVRSYRTVSPLPPEDRGAVFRSAVCFLLHFPGPRGRWALPTIVFCGARTFLQALRPGERLILCRQRPDHSEIRDAEEMCRPRDSENP